MAWQRRRRKFALPTGGRALGTNHSMASSDRNRLRPASGDRRLHVPRSTVFASAKESGSRYVIGGDSVSKQVRGFVVGLARTEFGRHAEHRCGTVLTFALSFS